MPATTAETLEFVSKHVTVAPLVLLSVVDHYNRAAKGTRKRVVGVLLGQNDGKDVRVSNSFAGKAHHCHDFFPPLHHLDVSSWSLTLSVPATSAV